MPTIQRQIIGLGAKMNIQGEDDSQVVTPCPTLLTYDTENPFAVDLTVLGQGGTLKYSIERKDLFTGRYYPTGSDLFRITPADEMGVNAPENTTIIAEMVGEGARILMIQTDELSDFLNDTTRLMPLGKEPQIDIDDMLTQLLKEEI